MSFSRRSFIQKCGGAAFAALALNRAAKAQINAGANRAIPETLFADPLFNQTAASFKKLVGSEFTLYAKDSAAIVVLGEVKEFTAAAPGIMQIEQTPEFKKARVKKTRAECFSLSFAGAPSDSSQATYTLWHPRCGRFDLFMVPAVSENGEARMHAVINRI